MLFVSVQSATAVNKPLKMCVTYHTSVVRRLSQAEGVKSWISIYCPPHKLFSDNHGKVNNEEIRDIAENF